MKKLKSIFSVAILSVFLAGNVLANDTTGGGVFSFFSGMVTAVVSFVSAEGGCRPRECDNCRPGYYLDESGNCRPI